MKYSRRVGDESRTRIRKPVWEVFSGKDEAIIRNRNRNIKLITDRVGDLYYMKKRQRQVKAPTTEGSCR